MPTIYDVAKQAGVSIATVSAVLNRTSFVSPELTKRVKDAVKELDYTINHLARSMQTRKTRTVGMLIPEGAPPDPFYAEVTRGAEDAFRKKGYLLILGHTYNRVEEQSRYLADFRSRLVDGVLLFQAPGEDEELTRLLHNKCPIVFVGRIPQGIAADVVATDIAAGTKAGVSYLLSRGHKRIGLLTVEKSMSVSDARLIGWRQALKAAGIAADPVLAVKTDLSAEGGQASARQILSLKARPTALFVDNLVMTIGVLRALQVLHLECPKDVEVMSSDDAEWLDVFRPVISTVVQPSYQLGVRAAEMLLRRIRHPGRPHEKVLLKPTLHIRT